MRQPIVSYLQLPLMVAAVLLASFAVPESGAAQELPLVGDLVSVPRPNLDSEEEAVREQLLELRAGVDRLLEARPVPAVELAARLGELGGLYYLYDSREAARACFENATVLQPENPRWHYLLAALLNLEGRNLEALTALDRVLQLDTVNVPSLIRKGRLLFDLARYEESRAAFEAALAIDGSSAAALGGLGNVEVRLGEHAKAIPHLRRALVLQPEADSLYYPLATALRATGETAAAREAFAKNNSGRLFYSEPWVASIEAKSASSEGIFHAGNRAMRRGDMAAAASFFEAFLQTQPDHIKARFNLALSYLQLGRSANALALLDRVLKDDPEVRGGQRLVADVLAEGGQWERSLEHFELAFNLDPASTIAADWATVLAKLGRVDEGLDLLRPFVGEDSQEHYARLKFATILATSGRSVEALPILQDLIDSGGLRKGVRSEALYHIGSLQLADGKAALARSSFERALVLDPSSTLANSALAPLLARGGELHRAAELFEKVVTANPADDRAQFGLAMCFLLDGRDRAAKQALESAVKALPENDALHHALARLLATSTESSVRDGARAVGISQELLRRAPNPEFAQTLAMAFAETGAFDRAVSLQEQVVLRAESAGRAGPEHTERLRRLELYRDGKPVRSPWTSGS